jgi:hypothetical protein
LQARRHEIEQTILARVYAVSDPTEAGDPEYAAGLRAAVTAAVSYGLSDVGGAGGPSASVPPALLAQARHAARSGVSLDTVLRRYVGGHTLLCDFVMQEAKGGELVGMVEFQRLTRAQATLFDRVVDAVAAEYRSEIEAQSRSLHQRRAECVQRLLAGELIDPTGLDYELEAWHVAAIAAGIGAEQAIRDLANALDRRLLFIDRGEGTVWAWFGGRHSIDSADLVQLASRNAPAEFSLAVGEPGRGLDGWRLTHRQAASAWPIALRGPQACIHYTDVALLASMLQDEVLITSLQSLFLAPLAAGRDGGATLRQTIRAYFDARRNVSSAASALGVTRKTVSSRLRAIEERIGRPLDGCAAEMEAALKLDSCRESSPRTSHIG